MNEYTAKNIQILDEYELDQPWIEAKNLVRKYPNKNPEFIHKGILLAAEIGFGKEYFIDKYIIGIDLPKDQSFENAWKDKYNVR